MAFEWRKLPFIKAIQLFVGKLVNVPTQRWDDLSAEEHDWAFAVSRETSAGFLEFVRGLTQGAIERGTTFAEFKRDFNVEATNYGKVYSDRRIRTILETNLRTAYSAGRREQQDDPDIRAAFPYRQWIHGDSRQPRPVHLGLDLSVFPADDPFWDNHYPPIFGGAMAWGCKCSTRMLSPKMLERRGLEVSAAPQPGEVFEYTLPDGRKGSVRMPVVQGVSAPGLSRRQQREQVLQGILERMPPELRLQFEAELQRRNGG